MRPSWWEAAFEHLATEAPIRLVVVRWDGGDDAVVEWANPATAALVGMDADAVAGRQVSEVYPARYMAEVVEHFQHAREHGTLTYEAVRELPSGRRTLAAGTSFLGDDLFLSYALDVTAEREAQRSLDEVTRLTGTGLYHWNVTDDELSWTDEMFHLLGHEPGSVEPTTRLYLDHIHPDDRPELEELTARALAGTEPVAVVRHRLIRRDGAIRTVDVRAQAVSDADRLLYVLGVVRDVTDEVELQRHTELVRRAEEQQRTALTVHDKVVQALATVVLALDLGELETARSEAATAVAAAQTVVADLLAEVAAVQGTIAPGALRVIAPSGDGA